MFKSFNKKKIDDYPHKENLSRHYVDDKCFDN